MLNFNVESNFHVQARLNRVARILSPIAPSSRRYLNRGVISATLDNSESRQSGRHLERSARRISYSIVRYTFSVAKRSRAINSQSRRASEVDIPRRGRLVSGVSLWRHGVTRVNVEIVVESFPVTRKNCFVRVGSIGTERKIVVGLIKGVEIDGESLFNVEARSVNR